MPLVYAWIAPHRNGFLFSACGFAGARAYCMGAAGSLITLRTCTDWSGTLLVTCARSTILLVTASVLVNRKTTMGAIIMLVNYSCLPMEMHLCIFSHYMLNRLLLLNFVYMLCLFAFCLVLLYSSYMVEIKLTVIDLLSALCAKLFQRGRQIF